jgi:hypothetical protein
MKNINIIYRKKYRFLFIIIFFEMSNLLQLHGQDLEFIPYSSSNIENLDAYKVGNIYQKDLLLFIDILKECHPAFSPGLEAPFKIDSLKQEGYKWAYKCKSINHLNSYLQSIASLLNDGHTSLIPDFNNSLYYPFTYFNDNKNIYLRAINKEFASFLGKQISKINGHPILEVINSFRNAISCDNEVCFQNRINNQIQIYSMWKNNQYCLTDSTLLLSFSDSTSISLRPILKKDFNIVLNQTKTQSNPIRQNNKQPFQYKLISEENICYLQFNSCSDQSTMRYKYFMSKTVNSSEEDFEKELSKNPRFDYFLNEMFQTIQSNHIRTLVIDVRGNGGGNSKLCDILLSWLKPQKLIKSGSSSIRISEFWEQHYPTLIADYKQAFAEKQQFYEIGKLYPDSLLPEEKSSALINIDKYFLLNKEENKIFKGNVVFIQDAGTYSSAGMLITDAIDNNIGIVIGGKSSYRPCDYGDALAWELPNTKIRGIVSHQIFFRPDITKCNESSLMPNFYLAPNWSNILENKDICWEWILKHYGNCKSF